MLKYIYIIYIFLKVPLGVSVQQARVGAVALISRRLIGLYSILFLDKQADNVIYIHVDSLKILNRSTVCDYNKKKDEKRKAANL